MKITTLLLLSACINVAHSCEVKLTLAIDNHSTFTITPPQNTPENSVSEKYKPLINALREAQDPDYIKQLLKGYGTISYTPEADNPSLLSILLREGAPALKIKQPDISPDDIKKYVTTVGTQLIDHSDIHSRLNPSPTDYELLFKNYEPLARRLCKYYQKQQLATLDAIDESTP